MILIGRLTREPDVRYSSSEEATLIARYTLAVDRKFNRERQSADFINCVAFGKAGELAEKYFHKGLKIAVTGRIQTGSYTGRDGRKVYTADVIVEEQEFAESKNNKEHSGSSPDFYTDDDGFINIPEGMEDELPFR